MLPWVCTVTDCMQNCNKKHVYNNKSVRRLKLKLHAAVSLLLLNMVFPFYPLPVLSKSREKNKKSSLRMPTL